VTVSAAGALVDAVVESAVGLLTGSVASVGEMSSVAAVSKNVSMVVKSVAGAVVLMVLF
jgi:fumarate reductase subunit D